MLQKRTDFCEKPLRLVETQKPVSVWETHGFKKKIVLPLLRENECLGVIMAKIFLIFKNFWLFIIFYQFDQNFQPPKNWVEKWSKFLITLFGGRNHREDFFCVPKMVKKWIAPVITIAGFASRNTILHPSP